MPEPAAVRGSGGPVVEDEPARDRHGGMRPRALGLPVRMIGRLAVPDADVAGVDVPVPCRQAGDTLIRQLLSHVAEGVIGREFFL